MEKIPGTMGDGVTPADEQALKQEAWAREYAEMERRWEANRSRLAEVTILNKATLLSALADSGIAVVVVAFDGSGDDGQVEEIKAFTSQELPIELPAKTIEYQQYGRQFAEPWVRQETVRDALEYIVYALLDQSHGGWENDDGAYGEFTFNVALCSIELAYHERYTETNYSEHEF